MILIDYQFPDKFPLNKEFLNKKLQLHSKNKKLQSCRYEHSLFSGFYISRLPLTDEKIANFYFCRNLNQKYLRIEYFLSGIKKGKKEVLDKCKDFL